MSGDPVELPPVTPAHYRVLCGVALGAIFLVLFHDGLMLAGLLAMVLGIPALFLRVRLMARQLSGCWRRRGMDMPTGQVMLQDELWNETRGEQRRMGRWLAWWKMRR